MTSPTVAHHSLLLLLCPHPAAGLESIESFQKTGSTLSTHDASPTAAKSDDVEAWPYHTPTRREPCYARGAQRGSMRDSYFNQSHDSRM